MTTSIVRMVGERAPARAFRDAEMIDGKTSEPGGSGEIAARLDVRVLPPLVRCPDVSAVAIDVGSAGAVRRGRSRGGVRETVLRRLSQLCQGESADAPQPRTDQRAADAPPRLTEGGEPVIQGVGIGGFAYSA